MNEHSPVDEVSAFDGHTADWQQRMGERAGEYLERGREAAQKLGGVIEHEIRSQPSRSVLIAAGVGFAIGMLWSRRS